MGAKRMGLRLLQASMGAVFGWIFGCGIVQIYQQHSFHYDYYMPDKTGLKHKHESIGSHEHQCNNNENYAWPGDAPKIPEYYQEKEGCGGEI